MNDDAGWWSQLSSVNLMLDKSDGISGAFRYRDAVPAMFVRPRRLGASGFRMSPMNAVSGRLEPYARRVQFLLQ